MNERSLIGQEVAGYYIEDVIGKGGMAVVYLALDPRLSRRVALKILNPALSVDERFRQRFILESRTVASIEHPNIIPIYEANSDDDGVLFIAMRYVDGSDLRRYFYDHGPLPLAQVNQIFAQVAAALDTAHAHDLIHRDVKPANILLARDHVYLTDFGITKHRTSISGLTQTDQFIGTPKYMAPEQINKEHIDGRCDQYALACVVYEALTGRLPFQRDNDIALLWAHLAEAPTPITVLRPDLPLEVDGVMMRALAKSPEQRFASCGEFVATLRDAISGPVDTRSPTLPPTTGGFAVPPGFAGMTGPGYAVGYPTATHPSTPASRKSGKMPLILAGVIAALAAVVLVVLVVLGNGSDGGWTRYAGSGAAPLAFDHPSAWTAKTHGDLFALASPKEAEFEALFVAGVGADWSQVDPIIQSDPEEATGLYVQLAETVDAQGTAAQLKASLDGMLPGTVDIAKEPILDSVGITPARRFEGTISDSQRGGRLSFTGYVVPRTGKPLLVLYFCASNGCGGQALQRMVGSAKMN